MSHPTEIAFVCRRFSISQMVAPIEQALQTTRRMKEREIYTAWLRVKSRRKGSPQSLPKGTPQAHAHWIGYVMHTCE
jgi:hypothetical protein